MSKNPASGVVGLLQLEPLEDGLFRGPSRDIGTASVFGGQLLGQALAAAQQTVDAQRAAHSLHAYFLRPGDIHAPVLYEIKNTRDGGSFSLRQVTATQHEQIILTAAISFQRPEPGFEHQAAMPTVPAPEELAPVQNLSPRHLAKLSEAMQRQLGTEVSFEFRHVPAQDKPYADRPLPVQHMWFRLNTTIEHGPAMHRALLAYASDFNLLGTATLPHDIHFYSPQVQMASIDHALWFHRPFRIDEWMLYAYDSPTVQGARGLARGQIFSRDGRLLASTIQEGLIRLRKER